MNPKQNEGMVHKYVQISLGYKLYSLIIFFLRVSLNSSMVVENGELFFYF